MKFQNGTLLDCIGDPDNTGTSNRRQLDVIMRLRLHLQASRRRIDV